MLCFASWECPSTGRKGDFRDGKKGNQVQDYQPPKFAVRKYNRCPLCGRVHGYMRRFNMCRCCFRKLAREGKIPGVVKSSW